MYKSRKTIAPGFSLASQANKLSMKQGGLMVSWKSSNATVNDKLQMLNSAPKDLNLPPPDRLGLELTQIASRDIVANAQRGRCAYHSTLFAGICRLGGIQVFAWLKQDLGESP